MIDSVLLVIDIDKEPIFVCLLLPVSLVSSSNSFAYLTYK